MSELPKGWADTSLGEITVLRGEKLDPATVPDAPFVGLEDIEPHTSRILKSGKGSDVKSSVARFSAGDVLYSRLRPYLNKVTVPDFDGVASAEILVLQPTAATEAEFVRRRIMTREFLDFAALLDKGDRPRVNFKEIAEFQVALPPLSEQQRIVAKVDGLTARTARARKELDRIPTLIARYKQRLLALAFSEFGSKTEVENLPFSDVVSSAQNGISKRRGDAGRMMNVLRLADLTDGHFIGDDPRKIMLTVAEKGKYGLEADDLICIRVNGSEKLVGRMLVWEDQLDWAFCDHFIRFKINSMVCLSKYVSYFFASDKVRAQIESSFVSSAGQKTVSQGTLGRILVPVPPLEEQAKIVRRIESAFGWLNRVAADHVAAARLLPKLNAAILGKAFQGKLVPQDPNDEPANVLLDRIKRAREAEGKKPKSGHGRKPNGSKAMTEKPLLPREQLLKDSEKWPSVGLPFEAIAMRNPLPHDALRDALFELLSGSPPVLQQRFDTDAEVMVIQRVAA